MKPVPQLKIVNPFRNLFEESLPDTQGARMFFRMFEAFLVIFTLEQSWEWALYTLRLTDVVLPLGIANYVDVSFMFGNSLPVVTAGVITLLFVLGLFRISRFAYFIGVLLWHLLYAVRFSQGEIPHSVNLFAMSVLGLSLAMIFFSRPIDRQRFTMGFTYFYLGLAYSLAGICKIIGTGPGWSDGRHLWMWINEKAIDHYSKFGTFEINWLQQISLDALPVSTLILTVGLVTELSGFLVWWKRLRIPVLAAILIMHVGIYYSMNIWFKLSAYELLLLLIPFPYLFDLYLSRKSSGAAVSGGLHTEPVRRDA